MLMLMPSFAPPYPQIAQGLEHAGAALATGFEKVGDALNHLGSWIRNQLEPPQQAQQEGQGQQQQEGQEEAR